MVDPTHLTKSSLPRSPRASKAAWHLVLSKSEEWETRDSRNILSSHTSSKIVRAVEATVRLWSLSCLTSSSTPYTAIEEAPILASTLNHLVAYTLPPSGAAVRALVSR